MSRTLPGMELREDDLFTLAGSLSELLGAPVTIEDRDTAVLAYSGGAQAVDDARIGTILGRQVPTQYRKMLADAGVFERLRHESGVVYVDLGDAHMTPRAVIAVRDGDDVLGSIWAAVDTAPTQHQESALRTAAPIVAQHMVRERDRADTARRRGTENLRALLGGGEAASRVADELDMRGTITVAAVAPADADAPVSSRLLGAVRLHLNAVSPRSVVAELDDLVYLAVCADEQGTRRIMADYVARTRTPEVLLVSVGREVDSAAQADRSRADADLVLGALRHAAAAGVVAGVGDVLAEVLALHSAEVLDSVGLYSPLTALARFDREHNAELVATARAYLDHGGDVADAAASLHVHPNTLRNRIRRASQSCGVDMDDVDTRLVLMLHLTLARLRPE